MTLDVLKLDDLLDAGPVIPVVAIERASQAVPLARALSEGGLATVEVMLRTPVALEAIERIASEVPEIAVGAGTVTSARGVASVRDAGARFLVSPGQTPRLLDAAAQSGLPLLAGCGGASEILELLDRGITCGKLFPARALGGPAFVAALAGPFPQMRLCPTGGIDAASAPDYLRLPNVACVGGSWIADRGLIAAGDWAAISSAARAASGLHAPAV